MESKRYFYGSDLMGPFTTPNARHRNYSGGRRWVGRDGLKIWIIGSGLNFKELASKYF